MHTCNTQVTDSANIATRVPTDAMLLVKPETITRLESHSEHKACSLTFSKRSRPMATTNRRDQTH